MIKDPEDLKNCNKVFLNNLPMLCCLWNTAISRTSSYPFLKFLDFGVVIEECGILDRKVCTLANVDIIFAAADYEI